MKHTRDKKMLKRLKKDANWLVKQLKAEGFVVQRYDSFTTNSIYLKLDYGVCHSIRISDHKGKKHLNYRYNILSNCQELIATKNTEGKVKYYFPLSEREILIKKVLYDKRQLLSRYGPFMYQKFMDKRLANGQTQRGFWEYARVV